MVRPSGELHALRSQIGKLRSQVATLELANAGYKKDIETLLKKLERQEEELEKLRNRQWQ